MTVAIELRHYPIANLFDARHIFGKDAQRRALAVIGDGAAQFDNAILDAHIDARARSPGLLRDLGQDTVADLLVGR